ncbi:MAG: hypothetical protein ACM3X6_15070 [Patescibacteria group bacterium]
MRRRPGPSTVAPGMQAGMRLSLGAIDWRWPALGLGAADALYRLLLAYNPDACYLMAAVRARDLSRTLPEAMAAVRAWAWWGLILTPLCFLGVLTAASVLLARRGRPGSRVGDWNTHLGVLVIPAGIILAGRFASTLMVAAGGLRGVMRASDLSPGVGLALLARFAPERIGAFAWELLRGLDLSGLLAVAAGARLLASVKGWQKVRAFAVASAVYGAFLILRWLWEGPLSYWWRLFWTA